MKEKIYWDQISADDMKDIKLTFEDFFKLMDCYYGNVFITDGDGYILYMNKWGWGAIGKNRSKYLGKHVQQLVEDGVFKYSVTMEVLKTRQPAVLEAADIDGKKFWVHAVPVFDQHDEVCYTVHFSQYETEISGFLNEIEQNKVTIAHMRGLLEHYAENLNMGAQMVYCSQAMAQVLHYARRVAQADGAVLVEGESGTGKELLSRYIFEQSNRNKETFLPINCAALPRELIESELFGYMPGAFTGASKTGKVGAFELADKGTIFLDEVGEIPLHVQAKLLRVLESGELIRVGSSKVKKVDVRIIAATNRNLEQMVEEGSFRGDLYYRLNVLPLKLPPLRERREDILRLADYYLNEYNRKYHVEKYFSEECKQAFLRYNWPGNVREMKNMIHRMVVTTDKPVLDTVVCMSGLCQPEAANVGNQEITLEEDLKTALQKYELQYIEKAIEAAGGNITKAAKNLGVHRTYIYRKWQASGKT